MKFISIVLVSYIGLDREGGRQIEVHTASQGGVLAIMIGSSVGGSFRI